MWNLVIKTNWPCIYNTINTKQYKTTNTIWYNKLYRPRGELPLAAIWTRRSIKYHINMIYLRLQKTTTVYVLITWPILAWLLVVDKLSVTKTSWLCVCANHRGLLASLFVVVREKTSRGNSFGQESCILLFYTLFPSPPNRSGPAQPDDRQKEMTILLSGHSVRDECRTTSKWPRSPKAWKRSGLNCAQKIFDPFTTALWNLSLCAFHRNFSFHLVPLCLCINVKDTKINRETGSSLNPKCICLRRAPYWWSRESKAFTKTASYYMNCWVRRDWVSEIRLPVWSFSVYIIVLSIVYMYQPRARTYINYLLITYTWNGGVSFVNSF